MKKVIDGAVYNMETAKRICEQISKESDHEIGEAVQKRKQLFKTKSGKYFFFINKEFFTEVAMIENDINPAYETMEVEKKKIIPVSYESAFQFASEIHSDSELKAQERIGKYFPELRDSGIDENVKIQKKIYLSEKAS